MKVTFDSTIYRSCRSGDNWCITWAGDDHQYTSCDDGWGWDYKSRREFVHVPTDPQYYNNRVWRIKYSYNDFNPEFLPNYPDCIAWDNWYGYGIISVDGILYHYVTCSSDHQFKFPFRGAKLIYSKDYGDSWYLHNGEKIEKFESDLPSMFFWKETDDFAFSCIDFVQCGKDNQLAKDDYIYMYSPNGKYKYHELNLARVHKDMITNREEYEFFTEYQDGKPVWSSDVADRGSVYNFPDNYGWYSWLPSVVYNKGLDKYIMVTGGTGVDNSDMHELPASLGIYSSDNPYGPWEEIYYTDNWVGDNPKNRLYQPSLSPKWISEDGTEMILIFSDASDTWGYQYRWNQQKIRIIK